MQRSVRVVVPSKRGLDPIVLLVLVLVLVLMMMGRYRAADKVGCGGCRGLLACLAVCDRVVEECHWEGGGGGKSKTNNQILSLLEWHPTYLSTYRIH